MSKVLNLRPQQVTKVEKAVVYLREHKPLKPIAALLATMRLLPAPEIPMAATDAVRKVYYNPGYMESLSTIEVAAALTHEALHKFGMFFVRFEAWAGRHGVPPHEPGKEDPARARRLQLLKVFNIAQDYLINYSLRHDWNLPLQENWLYNENISMDVISAEALADKLLAQQEDPEQSGAGGSDHGAGDMAEGDDICLPQEYRKDGTGSKDIQNVPGGGVMRAMEAEVKRDLASAVRYSRGMDAGKEKFTQQMQAEVSAPTASLARELNRLAARLNREGHTAWQRPHRWRKLPNGIAMPGPKDVKLGTVVLIRDTSGSTSGAAAQYFLNTSIKTLGHVALDKVVLMDVGNQVDERHVHTYTQAEVRAGKIRKEISSGGGTRFFPAFEWLAQNLRETPAAIVYLTDGGTSEADVRACYELWSRKRCPVLWALLPDTVASKRFAGWVTSGRKFGRVCYLPSDKT